MIRMISHRLGLAAGLALWMVALGACQDDFPPPSLVSGLRILGIAVEPPQLAPGEQAQIDALIALPDADDDADDGEVTYRWELCALNAGPDEGYACRNEELELPGEVLSLFDLGTEATAELNYALDPDTVQEACLAVLEQIGELPDFVELPDCDEGFEVLLRLTVTAQGRERVAIKHLFLWFEAPAADERNANPVIAAVHVDGGEPPAETEIEARRGDRIRFDLELTEESVETESAEDGAELEELQFSWFSSAGEWDSLVTFTDPGRVDLLEAARNILTIPSNADPATPIRVFVVVRDGRGGAAWAERLIRVAVE